MAFQGLAISPGAALENGGLSQEDYLRLINQFGTSGKVGLNPATGKYEPLFSLGTGDDSGAGATYDFRSNLDSNYFNAPYMGDVTPFSGQVIPGQDGFMYGLNPSTGQYEKLFKQDIASGINGNRGGDTAALFLDSQRNGFGGSPYRTSEYIGNDTLFDKAVATGVPIWAVATLGMAGSSALGSGAASAGGTSAGSGSGAAAAGGEETGGGGMWDWLDSIDGGGDTFTVNPSISDLGGNIDPITGFPVDAGGSAAAGGTSIWDKILNKGIDSGLNYLQNTITNKLNGSSGSVLDTIMNNPLQAGINFTPFLLSAYLANQQRGDLDGVLNQINSDAYQRSVLNPYDLQTSQARAALQNDMGLRGVAGSSFGNQQLNNFDYMHGVERGDLAAKAALASAGLQGQLINQRNLNSNLLLGSGLNATAKLFQPPQQMVMVPGTTVPQPAPAPKVGDNLIGDLFNLGKSALSNGGYFGGLFG